MVTLDSISIEKSIALHFVENIYFENFRTIISDLKECLNLTSREIKSEK